MLNLSAYKEQLFTITTCLLFVSIILGEKAQAVLSISMGLHIASILLLTAPTALFKNFFQNRAMLLFSFSFLFLLFSFFYSNNWKYLAERLQIKLPFLLYAVIIPSIGSIKPSQLQSILKVYILTIVLTVIGILTNYVLNFDAINQMYLESKIMPGPINHIRFSLLVVFAIYLCYYYLKNILLFKQSKATYIFLSALLFLFIFLHIYSVRSGLLALYAVVGIALINYFWASKNLKHITIASVLIVSIASISLLASPSLRNKITNTIQDITVVRQSENPNFNSIATRVASYQTALIIFKENIWFGCGQGDLKDKNDALFKQLYPTVETPIIPHNQFIYYLAATGLIGIGIFIISFTAPLWFNKGYTIEIIQVGYVILLLAFQFEAMIETQIGVVSTLLFILIPLLSSNNLSAKILPRT